MIGTILVAYFMRSDSPTEPEEGDFEVVFLDVWQGDCIYVRCGDTRMLIDGGSLDRIGNAILFLNHWGIEKLDYVICTHPHEDHCGGLGKILELFTVDTVISSVTEYSSKAFENFVNSVKTQKLDLTVPSPGDSFPLGDAEFTILGPLKTYADMNDNSLVLKLTYGETSFLFTGDAGYDAEQDMLEQGYDLEADVLKVGHHGSSSGTSYVWLREIMPEIAVISVGKGNDYGHPSEKVTSRLHDADAEILRTDEHGNITIKSDGKKLRIFTERGKESDDSFPVPELDMAS